MVEDAQLFHLLKLILKFITFFSSTMVIKELQELRGESGFGDRPASSVSKFSAGVNSDLENGSFWVRLWVAVCVLAKFS